MVVFVGGGITGVSFCIRADRGSCGVEGLHFLRSDG